jgi:hypothetical protein
VATSAGVRLVTRRLDSRRARDGIRRPRNGVNSYTAAPPAPRYWNLIGDGTTVRSGTSLQCAKGLQARLNGRPAVRVVSISSCRLGVTDDKEFLVKNHIKNYRLPLALAASALFATHAHADLVQLGPIDFSGSGLGGVNTILTIQSPANSTDESGMVAWNGSADSITGDAKTGASQTQTRSFAELGVTSADSLVVVFNALEPGNDANSITLNSLTLSVYTSEGTDIFNADLAAPINFADTFTGAGNSGFVFGLNAEQAAALTLAVNNSGASFDSLRAGLSASASNATGGFETFFIANNEGTVAAVPEPENYALLLGGLGAVGFAVRRRVR